MRVFVAASLFCLGSAFAAPFAYVPNDRQQLNVIDLATNAIVTRITVDSTPIAAATSAANDRVYVSDLATNTLQVIDTLTNSTIATLDTCGEPLVPAVNPSGTRVVVPCAGVFIQEQKQVMVFDTATFAATTVTAGDNPSAATWDPSGARFYVTGFDSVTVFDAASLAKITTIAVPSGAFATAIDPAGRRLYVASGLEDLGPRSFLSIVDLTTFQVSSAALPGQPGWIAIDPSGARLFITLPQSDSLLVVDSAGQTLATIQLPQGSKPQSVGVHPDGSRVYVQLFNTGTLSVLAAPSYTPVASVTYGERGATWGSFIGRGSAAAAPSAPGFQSGLWWRPSEGGWGITFTKRGKQGFSALFTYDANGNPAWHAGACAMLTAQICYGALYQVTGARFFGGAFQRGTGIKHTGNFLVQFSDTSHATLDYGLFDTYSRTSLAMERQPLAPRGATPGVDHTDTWWNPQESGWGMAITQQSNVMFLAWYVFDGAGQPTWLVSTCAVTPAGDGCSGTLYRTTGPPGGPTFDSSRVRPTQAGSVRITFTDPDNGVLAYTVDGVDGTKSITRQIF